MSHFRPIANKPAQTLRPRQHIVAPSSEGGVPQGLPGLKSARGQGSGAVGPWSSQLLEAALGSLACGTFSACSELSAMGQAHLWPSVHWLPLTRFSDSPLLPAPSTFRDPVILGGPSRQSRLVSLSLGSLSAACVSSAALSAHGFRGLACAHLQGGRYSACLGPLTLQHVPPSSRILHCPVVSCRK